MESGRVSPRTRAVEQLENFIAANHLAAHTRIPSERDLCEMWGLNRTTLRFALDALVARGRLYRKKGFGTYVADAKQVCSLTGVNSLSAEMRQNGIDLTSRILSIRLLEAPKQIAKKLCVPLGHKVYELVRLRSVNSVPGLLETVWLDAQLCPDFDQYYQEGASVFSIFRNIYRLNPVRTEDEISVAYLDQAQAELFGMAQGSPAFLVSGVTRLEEGTPLEFYKTLFRADRFQFVSVITRKEEDRP